MRLKQHFSICLLAQVTFISLSLISCKKETTPTITIEVLERRDNTFDWRIVADPAPEKDLVVIIGHRSRPDDWYDYDSNEFLLGITRSRYRTPFYVVISKHKKHSQTYEGIIVGDRTPAYILQLFVNYARTPFYINPLPAKSVVGEGIHIDIETLVETLPATTFSGHIIPKGHSFVRYRVGDPSGIARDGSVIKKPKLEENKEE